MPTYEFRCPEGHEFEKFYRKISDAPMELACPECGKIAPRLVSGGAALLFKGSGFYLTDYGKNAHRTSGTSSGNSESKGTGETSNSTSGSASESKSSDAKPAESKPAESKPAETKPAEKKPPNPSSGSSNSDT
jgi:putative FmdB family regulatory protein